MILLLPVDNVAKTNVSDSISKQHIFSFLKAQNCRLAVIDKTGQKQELSERDIELTEEVRHVDEQALAEFREKEMQRGKRT